MSSSSHVREFSLRATLVGMVFGIFFAVANAYLALKIGTTISASIPAAIMAMAVMRVFRKTTILEYNIVQTVASVGEGLAGGVIFSIPALILLGETPSIGRIALLSTLGGILGILFMIPMRRFLIVEEHEKLPFPEGTACAEILKASKDSKESALMACYGFSVATFYKACTSIFFLLQEMPTKIFGTNPKVSLSVEASPALLGVGYIIGPRISALMLAGGLVAWLAIIPLIEMFGASGVIIYPSTVPVSLMTPDDIWSYYVRYIGAGTVAIGGLISLLRISPMLYRTVCVSFKELKRGCRLDAGTHRTDLDISMGWLLIGSVSVILTLWLFPGMPMNLFTIVLLVILAFFFTAVTSLTVGLVGSTSNPVSGMTLTVLFLTCAIFSFLGWTERVYLISAITMGCVACVAICMAGTTSQDLKTGFLLKATPRSQQLAEVIGVILPSLALGYTLYILNEAYQIGSAAMPAPQAVLMSIVANGVIAEQMPYALVGIGVVFGLVMEMLKIPVLPFALGIYLPLSLSTATMVGGLVKALVDRTTSSSVVQQRGVLLAAGLVGGDAVMGIVIAALTIANIIPISASTFLGDYASCLIFLLFGVGVATFILCRKRALS